MSTDAADRERYQTWVRQCAFLTQANALTPHGRRVVEFAIRWAPFGGASPADLMENFGVTPARYRQLLRECLDPRGTNDLHVRAMGNELRESLLAAWIPAPPVVGTDARRQRSHLGIKIKNLG